LHFGPTEGINLDLSDNVVVAPGVTQPVAVSIPNLRMQIDGAVKRVQSFNGIETMSDTVPVPPFPVGRFSTSSSSTFGVEMRDGAIRWRLLQPVSMNVLPAPSTTIPPTS
jgi:hypothetical protein